jgi:alpha-beta hydrolase superfamily lysophospholipase
MARKLLWLAGSAVLTYFFFSVAGGVWLASASLHLPHRHITSRQMVLVQDAVVQMHAQLRDRQIEAADGTRLTAWTVDPPNPNGSVVMLLHGVTDNRLGMAGFARLFLESGYSVLMPDARDHGESGGNLATYGLLETGDIHEWVDWLHSRYPGCVYGFGESMGAGMVLNSLREVNSFCAVIAESPFSDFEAAGYDRMARFTGVTPRLASYLFFGPVKFGILYARMAYHVDLKQVSPRKAVMHSRTPVLLIHGQADHNLWPDNSVRIFHAREQGNELWLVPGAAHCGAWSTDPQQFEQRTLGWLAEHRGLAN